MSDLKNVILRQLGSILQKNGLEPIVADIRTTPSLPDGSQVFAVGKPSKTAILMVSPAEFPNVVAEAQGKARMMRDHIGPELGSTILVPLVEGILIDRTYALLPFGKTPSNNRILWVIQRQRLKPYLMDWLRRINDEFKILPGSFRIESIKNGMTRISLMHGVPSDLSEIVKHGIDRLKTGAFRPYVVPIHNDLWKGNILLPGRKIINAGVPYPFFIIDWGGSRIDGLPFFDLIRLSSSLSLTPHELRKELIETCKALGCSMEEVKYYIAAALGDISLHLGQFPLESFLRMARRCFKELQKADI